ncbi:acetyltransferase [Thalassospira xiamenensis]|uniref:acetyltransferase n=1 Tax=Thalassospira xiamenensis TaxID=220697 RepID=UPI000DEDDD40|nr:acetyltransferase [Thalassospira xiamenensis]
MPAELVLVGASAEMLSLSHELGHCVTAICDPSLQDEVMMWGLPVFNDDETCLKQLSPDKAIIAIDNPKARRKAHQLYAGRGVEIMSLIGGRLGDKVSFEPGLIMHFLTNLSEGTSVGEGVRLNIGSNVMHNASLGDFVTIAPGAMVLGHVTIGDGAYIGANATILPNVYIGENAVVGAGAVVTSRVKPGSTVKGVPAR